MSTYKTVAIMQPTYLPWMGYFELIAHADIFVYLDTVQFERRSWQSRNRLKSADDQQFFLSVPVASHERETPLNCIKIADAPANWREKHRRSLEGSLGKAPYFKKYFPLFEENWNRPFNELIEINIAFIEMFSNVLDLKTPILRASQLQAQGAKAKLILNICHELGADCYYSSAGSHTYLEQETHRFESEGVTIRYQNWRHPIYEQRGTKFVSHLSIADALMNVGSEPIKHWIDGRVDGNYVFNV